MLLKISGVASPLRNHLFALCAEVWIFLEALAPLPSLVRCNYFIHEVGDVTVGIASGGFVRFEADKNFESSAGAKVLRAIQGVIVTSLAFFSEARAELEGFKSGAKRSFEALNHI